VAALGAELDWKGRLNRASEFVTKVATPLNCLIPAWSAKFGKKSVARKSLKNLAPLLQQALAHLEISIPADLIVFADWPEGRELACSVFEEISRSVDETVSNLKATIEKTIKVALSLK